LGWAWQAYTFRLLTMQCKWISTKHFSRFYQAYRQVLRFGGRILSRGQDFLNLVFKKVSLGKTQFGDAQKYLGWHCPRMPPRGYGPAFYTTKSPLLRLQSQKCDSLAAIAKYIKIEFTISRFSKKHCPAL